VGRLAGELIYRADLTIVTNSLSVANLASAHRGLKVVITGGVLRPQSLELVGELAEGAFVAVNVDTAILGADGVSATGGITTYDEVEARTNRAMVARARRAIVLADSSKIGRSAGAVVAAPAEIDLLITDGDADPVELAALRRAGLEVLLV
jgi:DeoR family transcriptional regulator of aga operon